MRPLERASIQVAQQLHRVGVSFWLILWVLTLPLFHIHTVTEAQQGVAHTVFSPDLTGEYPVGLPETTRSESTKTDRRHNRLRSGRSYPELAFTTPVPQSRTLKQQLELECFYEPGRINKTQLATLSNSTFDQQIRSRLLSHSQLPRAPPPAV